MTHNSTSVDPADVARFEKLGRDWWNPRGSMRALHKLNPLRVDWIKTQILRHARPEETHADAGLPLAGLSVLDVGCGGGILSEPLARLGALVTGIDPAPGNISIAQAHAREAQLDIVYEATTVEALAAAGAQFDVVCMMEVVEHVADVPAFIAGVCQVARPGGLVFAATLNRTFKSFALAIIGAEYVLRWVPEGTHQWEKFVTPRELEAALRDGGVDPVERTGVGYDPLFSRWRTCRDMDVNYMLVGRRAGRA
jgi:2-polyprenyl-6-hydroxyphenyl methylase/3-demethylubiquinone-9 3-methyltransferase